MDNTLDIQQAAEFVVRHFKEEWAMITGAPVTLVTVAAVLAVVIWYVNKWRHSHLIGAKDAIIESKNAAIEAIKERYQLKDDRLQDTLKELAKRTQTSTAEPEQIVAAANTKIDELSTGIEAAASKIASLESVLKAIQDRQNSTTWQVLPQPLRLQLVKELERIGAHSLFIEHNANPDCQALAIDLDTTFSIAGWYLLQTRPSTAAIANGITILAKKAPDEGFHKVAEDLRQVFSNIFPDQGINVEYRLPANSDSDFIIRISPKPQLQGLFSRLMNLPKGN
jgi:hypothetical protein